MKSEPSQLSEAGISNRNPATHSTTRQGKAESVSEVRFVRHADGESSSVRMDQAETGQGYGPHLRTRQLNEYVEWLKNPDSDQFHRIDVPTSQSVPAPRSSVANFQNDQNQAELERIEAKLVAAEAKAEHAAEIDDSEEIIQTIADAIASVLNETETSTEESNQPEPAASAAVSSDIHLPESEIERQAEVEAEAIAEPETEKLDYREIPAPADPIVPAEIAAWDVEDFRWPETTRYLLTEGSAAISQLTQTVLTLVADSGPRVAITGVGRATGATSIAISVARYAAESGKKVLLVDADLSQPSLSRQVGLSENISWLSAIGRSLDPAEVIIRSEKNQLCIMPLAPMINRSGLPDFIHDQLGTLVDSFQSSFDLILFDAGPTVQLISELSQAAKLADLGLIVYDHTAGSDFAQAREQLLRFGLTRQVVAQNTTRQSITNVA